MSAINEWFGYYNAIFSYIRDTWGEEELERYLSHIAKEAYSDVIPQYREGGLSAIAERYVTNFCKDGDANSAKYSIKDEELTIDIRCPAYTHSTEAAHPAREIGDFFCSCCEKLNGQILENAEHSLCVCRGENGACIWKIKKIETKADEQ